MLKTPYPQSQPWECCQWLKGFGLSQPKKDDGTQIAQVDEEFDDLEITLTMGHLCP